MDNQPAVDVFDNENPWRLDYTSGSSNEEKESGRIRLIFDLETGSKQLND